MPRPREAEGEGGELNVVPFLDILMNVLMFVLATVALSMAATVDTSPPRPHVGGNATSLGLSILIVPEGFSVKTSEGNVAPGCESIGDGLAVGKKGHDYDYAALNSCVARLKSRSADFAGESHVTLSANPEIPYRTLIAAMDGVRRTEDGRDLFSDVQLGIVR